MNDIEQILLNYSLQLLLLGAVVLVVAAIISLHKKHLTEKWKEMLFFTIVAGTIIPTLFMAFSTIYINTISSSGGPVHWHADIEVWACGKEIELKDPKGLSNKIGTATLHEHNDKRIHVEGVVLEPHDVSLGRFFKVIGGELSDQKLAVATNEGVVTFETGQACPSGEKGEVQLFSYLTDADGYYRQAKRVHSFGEYILAPFSAVPHGSCIIVEFGPSKERTEKKCRSYQVAEEIGKVKGEQNGN